MSKLKQFDPGAPLAALGAESAGESVDGIVGEVVGEVVGKPAPASVSAPVSARRGAARVVRAPGQGSGGVLTPKQSAFVDEYLVDLNATQAAIRAGYSSKTASQIASGLLGRAHVAGAIAVARAARAAKTARTAFDVLKDIQALGAEAWGNADLKTALKALELEGKHLGMFTDKLNLGGELDLSVLEAARARACREAGGN